MKSEVAAIVFLLVFVAVTAAALPKATSARIGVTNTAAGAGTCHDSGKANADACVYLPRGLAIDTAGNLYIADTGNSRIQKVDAAGMVTTVAGNGTSGYCGDGGPAVKACLDYPSGVALDASGNLYIADTNNNVVRKVDGSGTITTVAGSGTIGYCGDSGAATYACLSAPTSLALDAFGNLYIADTGHSRHREQPDPAGRSLWQDSHDSRKRPRRILR